MISPPDSLDMSTTNGLSTWASELPPCPPLTVYGANVHLNKPRVTLPVGLETVYYPRSQPWQGDPQDSALLQTTYGK